MSLCLLPSLVSGGVPLNIPLYKGECPTGEGNVIFLPGFHPADRNDVPARFVILVCILPTKILSLQGNSKLIADY